MKTECDEITHDSEENDTLIANSYGRFAKEHGFLVTVVSNDKDFIDKVDAEELNYMKVEYPREMPRRADCGLVPIVDCLADVANMFGAISLKGTGVRVWGVWRGKTQAEYQRDIVRLDVDQGCAIFGELERDLRVLEALGCE